MNILLITVDEGYPEYRVVRLPDDHSLVLWLQHKTRGEEDTLITPEDGDLSDMYSSAEEDGEELEFPCQVDGAVSYIAY